MIGLLAVILLFGISPAWGAKPAAKIYVDAYATGNEDGSRWADAFTDLQDALTVAESGDEIWVADGTYTPTNNSDRTVSFILKSGVKVYGGFAGGEKALRERSPDPSLTVLSGDIGTVGDDTDNSYHVVYADGVTDAVLDGFTVTGGYGDNYSAGAGMYTTNSALAVANCIFSHNKVAVGAVTGMGYGRGGGMYNINSAVIITNCTFIANQAGNDTWNKMGAGAGMYNEGYFDNGVDYQFPVITGCTFSDNVASSKWEVSVNMGGGGGGGMYNAYECSPTIDRCTFVRNLAGCGGGMLNYSPYVTVTNCIFDTNANTYSDGCGGAIYNMGNANILNCTFYRNGWRLMPVGYPEPRFRPNISQGGAIFDYHGRSTIANCIFSKNGARNHGGAIRAPNTIPYRGITLTNCHFYENISWQGWYSDPRDEVINHVVGTLHPDSADNQYDIDPLLVDPAGGDFHLSYDSPCIDAGYALTFGYLPSPYPFGLPDTDFEGDKRIVDADGDGTRAIDIGADEIVPNLPDLGAFLEDLADSGALNEATAIRLLGYVDGAQAALDQEEEETAIRILDELIADARASLGETETALVIEMKALAVIEEI